MNRNENTPAASKKRWPGRVAAAATDADDLFVRCVERIEEGFLAAAGGVSLAALSLIPSMSNVGKELALEVGRQSASWDREDQPSLVKASVPGAAYRTAAVMDLLGEGSAKLARRTVDSLFGDRRPATEVINDHYREIGRSVAMLVDEGLDARPLSQSIREHLREIRHLRQR